MAENDDIRDAVFFRLWIRLASTCPSRVAQALAHCTREDDYRYALTKLAEEERINLPPAVDLSHRERLQLQWLANKNEPAWGGHLDRGEKPTDPLMIHMIERGLIETSGNPPKGYVLSEKGRRLLSGSHATTLGV